MPLAEPNSSKPLALGIDAGGTYTDIVLVARATRQVLAQAKSLTTPHELSVGIARALDALHIPDRQAIHSVSLATTLATNAIVENKGGRVGLLLMGYDRKMLAQFDLLGNLPVATRHSLRGRVDELGREIEPVDESEALQTLGQMRGHVQAIAVSGYFGVQNPTHERRVRELAVQALAVPVVCGHELTGRLDAVKRAVTACLNARLLPVLSALVDALESCLRQRDIVAPLWMVGGEGRLLSADEVRQRPVETILSGPAASVIMARATTGLTDGIVIDMGGTTSDIAILRGGHPGLSSNGALVGGWPTSVSAVDVRTCGLGGDSHIQLLGGRLKIGPRRAVPVCLAAVEHDSVLEHLRRLRVVAQNSPDRFPMSLADFVVQIQSAAGLELSWQERGVLDLLKDGPIPLLDIFKHADDSHLLLQGIDRLEERGVAQRIGLTPTDLLHARARYVEWNEEAARLACSIVAYQMGLTLEQFCDDVEERVVDQLATEVIARLLQAENVSGWDSYLLQRALDGRNDNAPIHCRIALRDPLIGLGAPARAFIPRLAEKLNTSWICPAHAEVGVALGTVLGQLENNRRIVESQS